jgi:uncharacterized NAD(P)/FAD-binding protein YdhS
MAIAAAERARPGCAPTTALLGGPSVSHLAQTHEALIRTVEEKRLTIERTELSSLDAENGGLAASLGRSQGARRAFDSVLCAGPSKEFATQPLWADLMNGGLAQIDEVGLGLKVDQLSRVVDSRGCRKRIYWRLAQSHAEASAT